MASSNRRWRSRNSPTAVYVLAASCSCPLTLLNVSHFFQVSHIPLGIFGGQFEAF
ncbi:MAG: hypothetical protein M5U34_19815 [Chloroflexi bacterium]|nr:hypothetical protein [Chloroflexota bacterium]